MTEDVFLLRNASPMLLVEGDAFDSSDFIYELKLDGIRCLAYIDINKTELRNKRNKDVTAIYPELSRMYEQVSGKCILDGELIVAIDGVPDFYEVQRRSLMTNTFKIERSSQVKPVSFVCYDIIYLNNELLIDKPLLERKKILTDTIMKENKTLAISRYIEEKGIDFFNLAVQKKLEGVVAKKKNSYYYFGKRSKDWIKFKSMLDDDFVICGYVLDELGNVKSLVIGAYQNTLLIYQGHVSLGISKDDLKYILEFASTHEIDNPFDAVDKKTIWIKPQLVCTVKYMMRTHTFGLRQPVFKGLRDDKEPILCQIRL